MSDMAANATGHKQTDHLKIVALAELAADFAREVLAPGGFFVAKVLQGGTEHQLLARLKRDFAQVRHVKPAASRAGFGGALRAGDGVSRRERKARGRRSESANQATAPVGPSTRLSPRELALVRPSAPAFSEGPEERQEDATTPPR